MTGQIEESKQRAEYAFKAHKIASEMQSPPFPVFKLVKAIVNNNYFYLRSFQVINVKLKISR